MTPLMLTYLSVMAIWTICDDTPRTRAGYFYDKLYDFFFYLFIWPFLILFVLLTSGCSKPNYSRTWHGKTVNGVKFAYVTTLRKEDGTPVDKPFVIYPIGPEGTESQDFWDPYFTRKIPLKLD